MLEDTPHALDWVGGDISVCQRAARTRSLPRLARFAADALSICCDAVGSPPDEVVAVIRSGRECWALGHEAFDAVRELTIQAEQSNCDSGHPKVVLLYVAENAARVIYNASCPNDPFDEDASAWFLYCISQLIQCLEVAQREQLKSAVLQVYSSH